MDDFTRLQGTEHMFKWLADEPFAYIRTEVESILCQQVAASRLLSFRAASAPQWLTGARKTDDGSGKAILVRTAVAFEFELSVQAPTGEVHELQGVYSWVGFHLDDPEKRKFRLWLDIGGTLETFGAEGELKLRLYEE